MRVGWRWCSGRKGSLMTGESLSLSFANRSNTKNAYIGIDKRGQKQVHCATVPFFCVNKAVVTVITSKAFSVCTALSLVLPAPVFADSCQEFLSCTCPHTGHVLSAILKARAVLVSSEPWNCAFSLLSSRLLLESISPAFSYTKGGSRGARAAVTPCLSGTRGPGAPTRGGPGPHAPGDVKVSVSGRRLKGVGFHATEPGSARSPGTASREQGQQGLVPVGRCTHVAPGPSSPPATWQLSFFPIKPHSNVEHFFLFLLKTKTLGKQFCTD